MALPCAAADEAFSISIRTEGQKLLVIGNNRLDHDLQCDLEIQLGVAEADAAEYPSNQLNFSTFRSITYSRASPARSVGLILKDGVLAKNAIVSVLHSHQFVFDMSAAKMIQYGCRPREELPKKDQSRPSFDKL